MKTLSSAIVLMLAVFSSAMSEEHKDVVESKAYISRLQRGGTLDGADAPRIGVLREWNIAAASINRSIPESELSALYTQACQKIEELWGKKLLSFRSDDGRGSRYAVMNLSDRSDHIKQMVVALVHGNDSTTFCFFTNTVPFDYSNKCILLDDWSLEAKPKMRNDSP